MTQKHEAASSAYKSSSEKSMSGFEVVVELYKGIISNIEKAKASYLAGKLDVMTDDIQKTNKILIALQTHIDHENGGEAATFLNQFYNGIFASLTTVLNKEDPAAAFDEILASIEPVYQIWRNHAFGKPVEEQAEI